MFIIFWIYLNMLNRIYKWLLSCFLIVKRFTQVMCLPVNYKLNEGNNIDTFLFSAVFATVGIMERSPSRRPTTCWWQVLFFCHRPEFLITCGVMKLFVRNMIREDQSSFFKIYCWTCIVTFILLSFHSWPGVQLSSPAIRQHTWRLLTLFSHQWKHPKV